MEDKIRKNMYRAFYKGLIKIRQPQAIKYYGITHQTISNHIKKQKLDDFFYTIFLKISNEELIGEIVSNPYKYLN